MIPDHNVRHASARLLLEFAFSKTARQNDVAVKHQEAMAPPEAAKRILVAGVVDTCFNFLHRLRDTPDRSTDN